MSTATNPPQSGSSPSPLFAPCWGCKHTLQCETVAECISPGVSQADWEMVENIAIRLREMLWDDATDMMQGAMVGHPVECLAFAEWWIQRAKGLPTTVPGDYPVFRANVSDQATASARRC